MQQRINARGGELHKELKKEVFKISDGRDKSEGSASVATAVATVVVAIYQRLGYWQCRVILGVMAALVLFIVAASSWVLISAAVSFERVERFRREDGVRAGCGCVNGVTFCCRSGNVGGDGSCGGNVVVGDAPIGNLCPYSVWRNRCLGRESTRFR